MQSALAERLASTLDVAIVIAIPSSERGAYTKKAFDEWEIATRVREPRVAEINKIEETVRWPFSYLLHGGARHSSDHGLTGCSERAVVSWE
jgi:hypothetical protein